MKRIAYINDEGGVSVVVPAPKLLDEYRRVTGNEKATEDDALAWVKAKDAPPGAIEVEAADLPDRDEFRPAWTIAVGAVTHDLAKCRAIHMARIREARDALLAAKDIEHMRADEAGDVTAKARVAGEKQALRDLPATTDLAAAKTVAELKAIWPAELGERQP